MIRSKTLFTALVTIAAAFALALASPANSAEDVWYDVPNYGSADADAIMDNFVVYRSAYGRVTFDPGGYCRRVEYAPYLILGLDGAWNRLPTVCGTARVTQSWSDTMHLGYDGFKFRICGANGCGDVRYIRQG